MPKQERSKTPQWKLLTSHLLTSPENQKKIRETIKVARKKEKCVIEKQQLIKTLIAEDKKKKKVTCQADKLRQHSCLHVQGGGEGGRGGPPKL